jgi:hypothetical protein
MRHAAQDAFNLWVTFPKPSPRSIAINVLLGLSIYIWLGLGQWRATIDVYVNIYR